MIARLKTGMTWHCDHPHQGLDTHCAKCKTVYCSACAVPYPGNDAEMLCHRCGVDFFFKRASSSLWFGFCGGLFGLSIASARLHSHVMLALITVSSSYVLWSAYWGWHIDTRRWFAVYHTLLKTLRLTFICIPLLLLVRVLAAFMQGVAGGAMRQMQQALHVLLKGRPFGAKMIGSIVS